MYGREPYNKQVAMRGQAQRTPIAASKQRATARIDARIRPEQKILFERAAALRGVNLKTFMVDSMQEAALRTLEDHESIRLGMRERQTFIETLLHPPVPNRAFRAAIARYNKMVVR